MEQFLFGAIAMASAIVGLFFLRFWRETGDRLFGIFAVSFWLLGLSRLGLAMAQPMSEEYSSLYWVRFVAFLLIIIAIVDKNRPKRTKQTSAE